MLPVIEAAHEEGYHVITADYLPDNIAHKYSDEYVNVSIIDKEAVLKAAREKRIDGIMSFGVDPGVVSASYVQDRMGLPSFGPYESVCILQNKDRFRAFLSEHHFNAPKAKGYSRPADALAEQDMFTYPVIVKPTDSAGSKGVCRVDDKSQLETAVRHAFAKSIGGHIIIEEFIEKQGCSSDTDSFSIDGKLAFVSFNAQYFDEKATNPFTPAAYSWPSTYTRKQEEYLTKEIQRLITLLGMKTCVYNIETRVGIDGKPYIMELTPRGGGNRLCEMLRYSADVDLIKAITRYSVGDSIPKIEQKPYNGHWAEIILHSNRDGVFDRLEIDSELSAEVFETDLWIQKGDSVNAFSGANEAIGTLILKFQTRSLLDSVLAHRQRLYNVVLK